MEKQPDLFKSEFGDEKKFDGERISSQGKTWSMSTRRWKAERKQNWMSRTHTELGAKSLIKNVLCGSRYWMI